MLFKTLAIVAVVLFLIVTLIFIARGRSSTVLCRKHRIFTTPAEKVWKLWNDPESMKKWWGPKDYTAPVIKNDLRVGGIFLLSHEVSER